MLWVFIRMPQRHPQQVFMENCQKIIVQLSSNIIRYTPYLFLRHSFLAHLNRRLIGELIGYSWSVRPPSVCPFTMLKDLLLQNRLANQAKFYVEPPWVGGTKVCSQHLGHMTKMAALPIYGKNPSKIFFSRTSRPIFTKLGM